MRLLPFLLTLFTSSDAFLWRINIHPPAFLFGTVHVPYDKVWDSLSELTESAFDLASHIYFEGAMSKSVDGGCKSLPDGQILTEVLPSDVSEKLSTHMFYIINDVEAMLTPEQIQQGMTAEKHFKMNLGGSWERKKPIFAAIETPKVIKQQMLALDIVMRQIAIEHKREIGSLEAASDRCNLLNDIDEKQAILVLNRTLDYYLEARRTNSFDDHRDIIKNYNLGNLKFDYVGSEIGKKLRYKEDTSETDPELEEAFEVIFREKLNEERSKRMGERIVQIIQGTEPVGPDKKLKDKKVLPKLKMELKSFFFAVDVSHFMGRNRIQDIVREAGFSVDYLGEGEAEEDYLSGERYSHTEL